jgi:CRISPR-associated endoribonuclease Cas6
MDDKRFYKFIMETGLGEKNSLGFGMVNAVG